MILVAIPAIVAALFVAVTIFAVAFRRRAPRSVEPLPPVVLLRCVEAVRPAHRARFAADARAYRGPLRRVVASATGDELDGAHSVRSGIAPNAVGNRKALHLAIAHREAEALGWIDEHTIVVHADADVELAPGDLERLVAATTRTTVAFAAPAPRGGSAAAELFARAVVTATPQAFAAIDALARIGAGAPALAGKLVATPAPLLESIGGYESLVAAIGDDVALVDAVVARGATARMAELAVATVDDSRTMRSLSAQLARWLRVASLHRPGLLWAYPALVASVPLALALAPWDPRALAAALALLALRWALAAVLVLGPYRGRSSAWAIVVAPLADMLLLRAALAATGERRVRWEGRTYRVATGGTIEGVELDGTAAPARAGDDGRGAMLRP